MFRQLLNKLADNYLTLAVVRKGNFALSKQGVFVRNIALISLSHHDFSLEEIGKFHIDESRLNEVLTHLKDSFEIDELMYLSTCNRVEYIVVSSNTCNEECLAAFFAELLGPEKVKDAINVASRAKIYFGENAFRHACEVTASLNSLVVGEREIITQFRNAYEKCKDLGLTGDSIRLLVKKTIETAKTIYTQTDIARNPVSIVSLAYRKLRSLQVPLDARFIVIGSGVTNTAMARYLKKHGYTNFAIFNRTLAKAEKLATELEGRAFELSSLENYPGGFDVIVTCTASEDHVITEKIYRSLVGPDKNRKVVIDLAVPNDLDPAILQNWDINLIAVNNLNDVAKDNLKEREKSIDDCQKIIEAAVEEFHATFRQRRVELAMKSVPEKVKEIRNTAINTVFAKEIGQLDPQSKELLDKVIAYMEKKYISVPMKMAREILTDKTSR